MSKISDLPSGGSLQATDYLIAVRSGSSVKVQPDSINFSQVDLADSAVLQFGDSQDLTIVHNTFNSVINQSGTGNLLIQKAGSTKLTINASGIDVTGSVTADGLTVDGNPVINGTSPQLFLQTGASNTNWQIAAQENVANAFEISSGAADASAPDDTYTPRLVILNTGSVGIGVALPSANLHVYESGSGDGTLKVGNAQGADTANIGKQGASAYGATSAGDAFVYTSTTNLSLMADGAASAIKFSTGGNTERLRIDANGSVGIGTSSPSSYQVNADDLVVASSGETGITIASGTSHIGNIHFADGTSGEDAYRGYIQYDHTSNFMRFATNAVEAMRIDASGNLLVGTTSNSYSGRIVGDGAPFVSLITGTSASDRFYFVNDNGIVGYIQTSGSATAYNTSSDQRLKENIADADDAGSKIDAIQVRKFDWKADGSHQDYGMVAQELLEVAPEAVSVPEDSEEMMGVDYSKLVPMMLKEIQSLRARVAQLES